MITAELCDTCGDDSVKTIADGENEKADVQENLQKNVKNLNEIKSSE